MMPSARPTPPSMSAPTASQTFDVSSSPSNAGSQHVVGRPRRAPRSARARRTRTARRRPPRPRTASGACARTTPTNRMPRRKIARSTRGRRCRCRYLHGGSFELASGTRTELRSARPCIVRRRAGRSPGARRGGGAPIAEIGRRARRPGPRPAPRPRPLAPAAGQVTSRCTGLGISGATRGLGVQHEPITGTSPSSAGSNTRCVASSSSGSNSPLVPSSPDPTRRDRGRERTRAVLQRTVEAPHDAPHDRPSPWFDCLPARTCRTRSRRTRRSRCSRCSATRWRGSRTGRRSRSSART